MDQMPLSLKTIVFEFELEVAFMSYLSGTNVDEANVSWWPRYMGSHTASLVKSFVQELPSRPGSNAAVRFLLFSFVFSCFFFFFCRVFDSFSRVLVFHYESE